MEDLLKVKAMGIGSLMANWLSRGLVIENKELLMLNVLVGYKLVVECDPGLGPGANTICNIYK